ncbi:D-isomer specific 2-hydroxyacid dehydrogenase family protein [Gulosibacter molinativorax]|uniref:Hydroxyacid dehydrogenase n=1 Tax=Gulosibacter molinativorax TaxID=256821 RepID=A0ABT7C3G4_9MICO|nr:D-isomer specific 2-hydroxyacid dehydrogenase family protein [Gulosibacter molinativorax]MDJ1369805.1 hydroxyacid dehydrogenase [Gulosibacter molinativorax]QUY61770.1 Phosphoglycerate dehydrogenase [Gulosibacter molinativorax]
MDRGTSGEFTHDEVLAEAPRILPAEARPEPGSIAILPEGSEFADGVAVREAGGVVAPLSDATRGLIYTTTRDVDTLVRTLDAHPGIGWVQLPFAGIDAYGKALIPAAERGVLFTSAKGSYAQPVAEHALTLTLATLRQLPMRLRATSWGESSGQSLYGANVVVVGAGGIALEYLRLLESFGARTTVVRRRSVPVAAADLTVTTDELDVVLPEADVVMLAAASTDETRALIDASRLASMKPSAVLVNIARGKLVDTDALVAALDAGMIFGAGLDVTDPEPLPAGHPLYSHERCVVTPHTADTPEMVQPLLEQRIRDNVRAFLETGEFVGVADPRLGY